MQDTKDGLYLNDVWVSSPDGIAVTYQGNDLTKPDTMESSYSNTFQLPDSLAVRELTRNAEQLDAGSGLAFQTFTATVINGGETTFRGFAELNTFNEGWSIALFEEKTSLFERLDRSIRTADLSRFNHPWTLAGINQLSTSADGACYPCVDYGLLDSGEVPLDTVFPAVYGHTIISQMLSEEGYKLTGTLPEDPLYRALTLPFVESEPTAKDEQFRDDRKARVGLDLPDYSFDTNNRSIDRIQPYTVDNRPLDVWQQGKLMNFDTTTHAYVCDTAMRLRVEAFQQLKLRVRGGAFEVILIIEKNGQEVARQYDQYETGYNLFNLAATDSKLNRLIDCQKGDILRIRFIAQRRTKIGGFDCIIYGQPDQSWVSFTPDLTITFGDAWTVSRNLPDLTGLQLLKSVAFICGGSYTIDVLRKQLSFTSLSETTSDTANAVDWSDRVSELENLNWSPKLEPYGQKNGLKWKETDGVTKGYGDGVISINAPNLPAETTLFEMPFSASALSLQTIPEYGKPLKVTLRTVTRAGAEVTINQQSTSPRLVLNFPSKPVAVKTKAFDKDGNATPTTVYLQPCWFDGRPNVAIDATTNFSLAFDATTNSKAERTLIQRYYGGLQRTLRRPRVATISMYLSPVDVATLNFGKPVRLQRVRVGRLQINDNYFVINKIQNYQAGKPTQVVLISFD